MTDTWKGYCFITRKGVEVFTPINRPETPGPPVIYFDDDEPIPLRFEYPKDSGKYREFNGLFTVAADQRDGDTWAIAYAQQDLEPNAGGPALFIKRRSREVLWFQDMGYGQNSIWVTDSGFVCGILKKGTRPDGSARRGGAYWRRNSEVLPVPSSVTDAPENQGGTSQGFQCVDEDGTPHFRDHHMASAAHPDGRPLRPINPKVPGGIRAIRHQRDGDWEVLQESNSERVIVFHHPTNKLLVAWGTSPEKWDTYVPVPPLITQHADGTATVAINCPRTLPVGHPRGLFIHSSLFKPYEVDVPATVAPLFLCMCGDGPSPNTEKKPGNLKWWQPKDNRRVVEGYPWSEEVTEPMEFILFGSESKDDDAQQEHSIEEAFVHQCAIGVYWDNPTAFPAEWRKRIDQIRAKGIYAFAIVQGYPKGAEDVEAIFARVKTNCRSLSDKGYDWAIMAPEYAGSGAWNHDTVRLITGRWIEFATEDAKRPNGHSLGVLWFGGDRDQVVGVEEVVAKSLKFMPVQPKRLPAPSEPVEPPEPPKPTIRTWFPKMRRFMSETELQVRGIQKQVNWNPNMDGKGHRPIWGSIRPEDFDNETGEGTVLIGTAISNDPVDEHERPEGPQDDGVDGSTALRFRMRPGEQGEGQGQRIDIQFVNGEQYQLTQMPGGVIGLRRKDAIDLQELWNDGILQNVEQVFHMSGTALRVIR